MIDKTSYFIFSCRRHAAAGHLRVAVYKTPDLSLHSAGRGIKTLAVKRHDSDFVIGNALTVRHLDQSERLNTHSPRLHIAQRHRLRGFLL